MVRTKQDRVATEAPIETAERRSETRTRAGNLVVLRTPNALPMEACLLDISSKGARVRVPKPVPIGKAVRIEEHEVLLSGTVVRCAQSHGAYEVGIALAFPLEMLGELRKLNAALLAESEPA
jgi:PilZ domain-containing protein